MLRTITISESLFAQLDREAKRSHLATNALAERLNAEQQAWREQFESLLARVHSRMAQFDSAEIENDITAASSEVKAARRANRRSH